MSGVRRTSRTQRHVQSCSAPRAGCLGGGHKSIRPESNVMLNCASARRVRSFRMKVSAKPDAPAGAMKLKNMRRCPAGRARECRSMTSRNHRKKAGIAGIGNIAGRFHAYARCEGGQARLRLGKRRNKFRWLRFGWCARRDSNPHDFTHCHLKAARLPIPPRALGIPAGAMQPAGSTAPM